jgi:hypothetical protein
MPLLALDGVQHLCLRRSRRRRGPEIGLLGELWWVTAMLLVHWIGDWGTAVGLPMVTKDGGEDRGREN